MNIDLHKRKIEKKKKKSRAKNGLLKKSMFLSKIKRQKVLIFFPSCLNQGRKDGSALMFY